MTDLTTEAALLGWATGAGLVALAFGLLGPRGSEEPPAAPSLAERLRALPTHRVLIGLLAAVAVGGFTGWPVAGLLAGGAVVGLPSVLGSDRAARTRTARLEALATWTEMLRDTLGAAAGLEQALHATVATTPEALRSEVGAVVARLDSGERLPAALRSLADDMADPAADLVVAALLLAAERQARDLGRLLGSLAESTREQVTMRLRIDAERARVRTSVRIIAGTTLSMVAGLLLLNRGYLAPFGSGSGQVALVLVGVLFGAAFVWMARIAADQDPPRLVSSERRRERQGART